MNEIKRLLLIGKKVKIKANSYLFELRTDAIASKLTRDVDYKQYNYLYSYHNSSECGSNCSDEDDDCKIHNGEHGYCREFEIYDSIDFFELDNVKLVKINHYGDEVWASDFEICFDGE
jgi:hypothetical protein